MFDGQTTTRKLRKTEDARTMRLTVRVWLCRVRQLDHDLGILRSSIPRVATKSRSFIFVKEETTIAIADYVLASSRLLIAQDEDEG